jgi:hypothetical protein
MQIDQRSTAGAMTATDHLTRGQAENCSANMSRLPVPEPVPNTLSAADTAAECDLAQESHADTAIREERRRFLVVADTHKKIQLGASLRAEVFIPLLNEWNRLGLDAANLRGVRSKAEWEPFESYNALERKLIANWVKKRERLARFDWIYERIRLEISMSFAFHRREPSKSSFAMQCGYASPDFRIPHPIPFFGGGDIRNYELQIREVEEVLAKMQEYVKSLKGARAQLLKDRGSKDMHYGWAALFVCCRWSFAQIERHIALQGSGRSRQAVSQAVGPIVERLGHLTRFEDEMRREGMLWIPQP